MPAFPANGTRESSKLTESSPVLAHGARYAVRARRLHSSETVPAEQPPACASQELSLGASVASALLRSSPGCQDPAAPPGAHHRLPRRDAAASLLACRTLRRNLISGVPPISLFRFFLEPVMSLWSCGRHGILTFSIPFALLPPSSPSLSLTSNVYQRGYIRNGLLGGTASVN